MNGGRVAAIDPGSAGEAAGLAPGDVILSANGEPVTDILAWEWAVADGALELRVVSDPGRTRDVAFDIPFGETPGVHFAEAVFDAVRTCDNACAFCFVTQLPPGLRASLYVRDDDYRLSFLDGNFITLTNLTSQDVVRILRMRVSPLHVSVHAVTPAVRRSLMCPTAGDDALGVLDELVKAGIEVHAQIVLVPGVNDGDELQNTLEHLGARAGIVSVGVVPVGYTSFAPSVSGSYEAAHDAARVLEALEPWRRRMGAQRGRRWVYGADELYLNAGVEVPPAAEYDDYPQFENGIGMVRTFLDELAGCADVLDALRPTSRGAPAAVLVTGGLFAPVLRKTLSRMLGGESPLAVLPVPNKLLGGNVGVAGLLSGRDIARAIAEDGADVPYLVPDIVLNDDGLTIDDVPGTELAKLSGADVRLVSWDAAGLAEGLAGIV